MLGEQTTTTIAVPAGLTIATYIGLTLSIVANVVQFIIRRDKATRERDAETIASLERSATATKGELQTYSALNEKIKGELDSLSEEYETLVGLDIGEVLTFAREGYHKEIRRLKAHNDMLKRRLPADEQELLP